MRVDFLPRKPRGKAQLECGDYQNLWPRHKDESWLDGSSVIPDQACPACGRSRLQVRFAQKTVDRDDGKGELAYEIEETGHPGLLIDKNAVGENRIFRFVGDRLFARGEFVSFLKDRKYTNVIGLRAGWLI